MLPSVLNAPRTFGPESLVNYEVGLKSAFLDRHLTVDVSAYYIDWSKVQLNVTSGGFTLKGNGGKAKSQGVETSVVYSPFYGFKVRAAGGYDKAVLTEDTPPGLLGFKGDRLPYVPRWTASLGGEYDFPLTPKWSGFAGASYRFIGDRKSNFNAVPVPRIDIPAYRVAGLHVGLLHDRWRLELFVKNLADERGITAIGPKTTNPAANPYSASLIQPRTIGISLRTDF